MLDLLKIQLSSYIRHIIWHWWAQEQDWCANGMSFGIFLTSACSLYKETMILKWTVMLVLLCRWDCTDIATSMLTKLEMLSYIRPTNGTNAKTVRMPIVDLPGSCLLAFVLLIRNDRNIVNVFSIFSPSFFSPPRLLKLISWSLILNFYFVVINSNGWLQLIRVPDTEYSDTVSLAAVQNSDDTLVFSSHLQP